MDFGETAAKRSFCSQWRVPVTVPGGVYVIPPAVVRDVGHGDLKKGERVLDLFVQKVRDEAGRKMLPPPRA
jgi:hypothetical protein